MTVLEWVLLALVIALGLRLLFVQRYYVAAAPPVLPALPPASPSPPDNDELQTMIDVLPVGLLVTDARGTVQRCNAAAAELLDLAPTAVEGHTIIHALRDYELAALLRQALAGQPSNQELNINHNRRSLLARVSVLQRGEQQFGLVVLQDVTLMRRTEQVRRDFVANVSHEFRTPLATAKLLVETAQGAVADDAAAAQGFLTKANRELDSLTRLVSEMLDLSRIEAGQTALQMRPLSLRDVLAQEVGRAEEQAARHGLTLDLEANPELVVMADESRLGQIVGNLVQNAIKFTPHGGNITVSATCAGDATFATVTVADTGIGIPAEDLERIFERFYKVDRARSALLNGSEAQGGTGLGLAIARHLVAAHGGRIWAKSEPNGGATFHFTIPLAGSAKSAAITL